MRRPTLLIVLLLALSLPTTAVAQGKTQHALKAVLEGSYTFVLMEDPRSPYDSYGLGVARGTAQGLGQTELFCFQQSQPSMVPILTHFFLIAANGDRIVGTYEEGHIAITGPASALFEATFQITGGTGRFAQATGELQGKIYLTVPGGNWMAMEYGAVWTFEGRIKY
jgi:hypothetical protein